MTRHELAEMRATLILAQLVAVVTQIPAEHRAGEGRRSLDGLDQGNNLLVGQFFGLIVVMAVPFMGPVSLELYPYRFSHADTTVFSRRLKSLLFIPPIRLPVLGQTYGTYLHYERTYTTNVPIL